MIDLVFDGFSFFNKRLYEEWRFYFIRTVLVYCAYHVKAVVAFCLSPLYALVSLNMFSFIDVATVTSIITVFTVAGLCVSAIYTAIKSRREAKKSITDNEKSAIDRDKATIERDIKLMELEQKKLDIISNEMDIRLSEMARTKMLYEEEIQLLKDTYATLNLPPDELITLIAEIRKKHNMSYLYGRDKPAEN